MISHITRRLGPEDISEAADCLRNGGTVAFPTETVYGLGADATNGVAVARVFEAKGRPAFNPLIAHVPSAEAAEALIALPDSARKLAEAFWPGPLTLVAPMRAGAGVSGLVTAGLETLGVRVPAHPVAQALLTATGRPVAAPSANRSGRISPTRAGHVLASLDTRIDAVLDAGPCSVGVESTILGVEGDGLVLLRPGGLTAEAIAEVTGTLPRATTGDAITAPGQLASHYAPASAVRLNATEARGDEVMIGFGPGFGGDLVLSPTGDLGEAAANLFETLHRADALAAGRPIAVAPIPHRGLGLAINDRLSRAAAPRPAPDA